MVTSQDAGPGAPRAETAVHLGSVPLVGAPHPRRRGTGQRWRFLARAASRLGASLEWDDVLRTAARLPVPRFADRCVIRLGTASGELLPPSSKSVLYVRLSAGGESVGILELVREGARRFTRSDRAAACAYARAVEAALDNARLYAEARAAAAAREETLAVVAHDLRNPLGVITMTAAMLLEAEFPADVVRRQLEAVLRSAQHMEKFSRDLMEASRLAGGKLPVQAEPMDPRTLLEDAVSALRPLGREKAIVVACTCTSALPLVLADRDRVFQVFSNLVGNAIKFTPAGGRVVIGADADGGAVRFRVADTGGGITADDLPHLFEKFWQPRGTRAGGVGLGLAIVKGIVEAHGGRVWAESTPGEGSTFSFTLPVARPPA